MLTVTCLLVKVVDSQVTKRDCWNFCCTSVLTSYRRPAPEKRLLNCSVLSYLLTSSEKISKLSTKWVSGYHPAEPSSHSSTTKTTSYLLKLKFGKQSSSILLPFSSPVISSSSFTLTLVCNSRFMQPSPRCSLSTVHTPIHDTSVFPTRLSSLE